MIVDFTNIVIEEITGEKTTINVSKDLGAVLYKSAMNKESLQLGRDLFNNGSIEVDKDTAAAIKELTVHNLLAVVQEAIVPMMDKIINEVEEVAVAEPMTNIEYPTYQEPMYGYTEAEVINE